MSTSTVKKTTGAMLLEFLQYGLPERYFHDEWDDDIFAGSIELGFEESILPGEIYPLSACGYLCFIEDGDSLRAYIGSTKLHPRVLSFEEAFNDWLKTQKTVDIPDGSPVDLLLKAGAVAHIDISKADVKNLKQVPPDLRRQALGLLLQEKLSMATALVTMKRIEA